MLNDVFTVNRKCFYSDRGSFSFSGSSLDIRRLDLRRAVFVLSAAVSKLQNSSSSLRFAGFSAHGLSGFFTLPNHNGGVSLRLARPAHLDYG